MKNQDKQKKKLRNKIFTIVKEFDLIELIRLGKVASTIAKSRNRKEVTTEKGLEGYKLARKMGILGKVDKYEQMIEREKMEVKK